MEKSIENIWKEGFLKNDALVAPKVNSLYTRKSIHIIDKFKRMFRINLAAIVIGAFVFLILSWFAGIPVMGAIFFVTLAVLVIINKRLLNGLEKIDKGVTSYEYLKAFNQWIKKQVAVNKKISSFVYPIIFMSLVLGFWFKDAEGILLGERLVDKLLLKFPDTPLMLGIPVTGIIGLVLVTGLLAFFGGKIYQWDLNLVYGKVLKKLDELLADLDRLRS